MIKWHTVGWCQKAIGLLCIRYCYQYKLPAFFTGFLDLSETNGFVKRQRNITNDTSVVCKIELVDFSRLHQDVSLNSPKCMPYWNSTSGFDFDQIPIIFSNWKLLGFVGFLWAGCIAAPYPSQPKWTWKNGCEESCVSSFDTPIIKVINGSSFLICWYACFLLGNAALRCTRFVSKTFYYVVFCLQSVLYN